MLMEIIPPLINIAFTVNRWVHLVAATVLVGGVLFFEFVVPLATADLKEEQQLAVFGRARWVFRNVVWLSVAMLILSGAVSLWRNWLLYEADDEEPKWKLFGCDFNLYVSVVHHKALYLVSLQLAVFSHYDKVGRVERLIGKTKLYSFERDPFNCIVRF